MTATSTTYYVHHQNIKNGACLFPRIEIQANNLNHAKRQASAIAKNWHHLLLCNQQGERVASKPCIAAHRFLGWD